jgi:uncharacterized protein YtpQ (UPF0354 family)
VVQAPFAGELFVMYVVDQPRTMRGLTQGDLRALGLDETQVHTLALANLSRAVPEPFALSPTDTPGLDKLASDDPYAAARLLLHDRWEPLNARLSGGLVACTPARDLVLVTGADDADALAAMRRMAAEEAASAPYPLSAQLLRWTPAGWEVSR